MDIEKMQRMLQAKGIRVKDDDPVFILIALNEIALDDMTKRFTGDLNEYFKQITLPKRGELNVHELALLVVVVILIGSLFGTTGYLLRYAANKIELYDANVQVMDAKREANAVQEKAVNEIDEIRKTAKWAGTEQGKYARRFYEHGGGEIAATCASPTWTIKKIDGTKWCLPNRRPLWGEDKVEAHGWVIP